MTLQILENALLMPVIAQQGRPRSGVFDANGNFIASSATVLSNGTPSPPPAPQKAEETLAGTHLFAGLGRAHFGHFLLESITRHWALAQQDVRSVLYARMPLVTLNLETGPLGGLHRALSGDVPAAVIRRPTRVERLVLPAQGFGHGALIKGIPEFRSFVRTRLQTAQPTGPRKLYIARSRLRRALQRVDLEELIEAQMRTAGYDIFYPERASIEEQCRRYQAAELIVGADGSAFHLAAFVARPQTRVAIYLRRNRPEMLDRLYQQFRAFSGIEPVLIDCVLPRAEQLRLLPEGSKAPTPLNIKAILNRLKETGFL